MSRNFFATIAPRRAAGVAAGFALALATAGLSGCVGYGFPGDYGYGSYPSGQYPGSSYPGNGYPGYGGSGQGVFRCESNDSRTRHCSADTRRGVRISRQLSDAPCIQGRSWGSDGRGVWVSNGCRAEFVTGGGGGGYRPGHGAGGGNGYGRTVRCESQDKRQKRCNVQVPRRVDIVRQLSDMRCVQGQTWGWDRSGIWVRGGCRAEFRVY